MKNITPEYQAYLEALALQGGAQGLAARETLEKAKTDYDNIISDRKGDPANEDLYNVVIREAKKKFDVYPSAVANAWVVQEYKKRGGTYGPVKKAEVAVPEGHTVEDVLRHDKGHDDWHASHGDQPCKDEADCARMRATYKSFSATLVKEEERDEHGRWTSSGREAAAQNLMDQAKFVGEMAKSNDDKAYGMIEGLSRGAQIIRTSENPSAEIDKIRSGISSTVSSHEPYGSNEHGLDIGLQRAQMLIPNSPESQVDTSKLSQLLGQKNPGNNAYDGPMLARHLAEGDTIKEMGMMRSTGVVTSVTHNGDGTLTAQFNRPDGSYGGFQNYGLTDIVRVNRSMKQ